MPIADVAGGIKLVPTNHSWISSARQVGTWGLVVWSSAFTRSVRCKPSEIAEGRTQIRNPPRLNLEIALRQLVSFRAHVPAPTPAPPPVSGESFAALTSTAILGPWCWTAMFSATSWLQTWSSRRSVGWVGGGRVD